MRITKSNNNKGHGAPEIPSWLIFIFYAVIYAIPVSMSFTVLAIIKWFGFLQTIDIYKWSLIIGGLILGALFLYVYLQDKGIIR